MPESGAGVGTPLAGTVVTSTGTVSGGLPLVRYIQRIGYRETAFFGLNHPDNDAFECREIWTKSERDEIQHMLLEAQDELEAEIRYPLAARWIAAERHEWAGPLQLRWGQVVEPGVLSDVVLQAGVVVSYAADPATIGPIALGTYAVGDVHLYHAGTDSEIIPSAYSIVAGAVTFSIPWARLVAPAYDDNPRTGWDYYDTTWRAATVDVRALTNDASTQAQLIWRVNDACGCACPTCADYRHTGCVYVRDATLGIIDVQRADYSAGVWTRAAMCRLPQWVEVSYRAGLTTLTRQAEDAIIRLAHAKMADEPCGNIVTQNLWRRDRNIPQVLTRERINCPFGMSDGAWMAWRFAQSMKLVRGGRPL